MAASLYNVQFRVNLEGIRRLRANIGPFVDEFSADEADRLQRYVVEEIEAQDIIDTGRMHDNVIVVQGAAGSYTVVVNVPYAGFVEFGTRFLAARPFFAAALQRWQSDFVFDAELLYRAFLQTGSPHFRLRGARVRGRTPTRAQQQAITQSWAAAHPGLR